MITPARIIEINKPFVPAVIEKKPLAVLYDRYKYIQEFVYMIKPYIEDDLELNSYSSNIDIQIIYSCTDKDYYVQTPVDENDDMFVIYINKYNTDKNMSFFGIDLYLQFITRVMCSSMRTIYQYINLALDGMDCYELDITEDCRLYCNDFMDRYRRIVLDCICKCIKDSDQNLYDFNLARWILYVVNTSIIYNTIIRKFNLDHNISFQNWFFNNIENHYYQIDYDDNDDIIISFDCSVNLDSDDAIIDHSVQLILYSLSDIIDEVVVFDNEYGIIDIDTFIDMVKNDLEYELRFLLFEFKESENRKKVIK